MCLRGRPEKVGRASRTETSAIRIYEADLMVLIGA
jgi:hypothetical protein